MALTRGLSACWSLVLAAETPTAKGSPARSDNAWIFDPDLPRSAGFGQRNGLPFFARTLARSVEDCARAADESPDCPVHQDRLVQPPPQPSLGPLDKSSMRGRHRDAETRW